MHKERNLLSKLSYKDHSECQRLINRIRKAQGEAAGKEALFELCEYIKTKNASAYASVLEAGEELIALHLCNAPSTLNVSLLSTNIIENSIRNIRRLTDRTNRWRPETSQADRWLASGLLQAEKGFRKTKGYKNIHLLVASLGDSSTIVTAGKSPSQTELKGKMEASLIESKQLDENQTL